MKINSKVVKTILLLAFAVVIHLLSRNTEWVENVYSLGFYPAVSCFMRLLFGWVPFSLGDLFYGYFVVWVIYRLFFIRRSWRKYKANGNACTILGGKLLRFLSVVYILFNALWGLNYNRVPLSDKIELTESAYSVEDLVTLNEVLLQKVNVEKNALQGVAYPSKKEMFQRAEKVFNASTAIYPFLEYNHASLKPSIWSWLGNYSGFSGYYNPFSGEAQVNTLVPDFLHPFIALHEIAHQVGYAKEDEANFAAFLVMRESSDTLFRYSGYLDLFLYANRNLHYVDSTQAQMFRNNLSKPVKTDLEEYRAFMEKHKSPISPVITWIYNKYLIQNQQPQGMRRYDYVTAHLIYYYRKYGTL